MNTTISPYVRILALVGLLVAAALVTATQLVTRGVLLSDDSAPVSAPHEKSGPPPAKAVPANKTAAKTTAAANPAAKPSAKRASAKATPAQAKAKPATRNTSRPQTNGLPAAVIHQLGHHKVVVVSLFTPGASVDRLALDEARAGAKAAGAGFVALDVLDERQGRPLTAQLGVLVAPAVLVYRKPAKLTVQIRCFADLETVAQAAANARS